MDEKQEIQSLRRELEQANYEYYVLDNPSMSDYDPSLDATKKAVDRSYSRNSSSLPAKRECGGCGYKDKSRRDQSDRHGS